MLSIIFSLVISSVSAHTPGTQKSVDEIIQEIMKNQNITNTKQIDCNKILDSQFEELGDAVMERMVGSHALHEQMDDMMGGEGSQSLVQMHTAMGSNWVGCGSGFGDMMSGGMAGGSMMSMMRMMGNYYPAYYANYNTVLFVGITGWFLFVVTLVIFALFWTGRITIKKKR